MSGGTIKSNNTPGSPNTFGPASGPQPSVIPGPVCYGSEEPMAVCAK